MSRDWELLGSSAIDYEIEQMPDPIKKDRVKKDTSAANTSIEIDLSVESRVGVLITNGFDPFDALHIACAEKGNAEVFLTTDDHIVKKANKTKECRIKVDNPLHWIMEVGDGKHQQYDE